MRALKKYIAVTLLSSGCAMGGSAASDGDNYDDDGRADNGANKSSVAAKMHAAEAACVGATPEDYESQSYMELRTQCDQEETDAGVAELRRLDGSQSSKLEAAVNAVRNTADSRCAHGHAYRNVTFDSIVSSPNSPERETQICLQDAESHIQGPMLFAQTTASGSSWVYPHWSQPCSQETTWVLQDRFKTVQSFGESVLLQTECFNNFLVTKQDGDAEFSASLARAHRDAVFRICEASAAMAGFGSEDAERSALMCKGQFQQDLIEIWAGF